MDNSLRLDRFVSESLQITRKESKALLSRGKITVNDVIEKNGSRHVAAADIIQADGIILSRSEHVYLMLNKPAGVVSASRASDSAAAAVYAETTVTDLVREAFPRRELFPAGRLDKTSTGFILLTDDGVLAHALLAPGRHVPKTYEVVIDTPLTEAMITGFAAGPVLADGTRLDGAEVRALSADGLTVEVILHQGVYHQIKRMFGLFDAGVNALHRTAIGPVRLDPSLKPGDWRPLTGEELASLR